MTTQTVSLHLLRWRFLTVNTWCDGCCLPSRFTVELLMCIGELRESNLSYMRGSRCVHCGGGYEWHREESA